MPVSWVSSGTRDGANHSGISRITEMKVMASPAPTSTRPSTPPGMLSANASWSWPEAHQQGAAGDHGAGAETVHQHPHRDLQARVDQQLQHGEEGDFGGAGVEPGRGFEPHDAEGGALADRHQVREDPDDPDQPGAGGGHSPIMPRAS